MRNIDRIFGAASIEQRNSRVILAGDFTSHRCNSLESISVASGLIGRHHSYQTLRKWIAAARLAAGA